MAGLEQLISDISAFLADNTENLAKFNDLIDMVKSKTGIGHEIQSGILELVSGNEDLTKMVKEATPLFTNESKGSIAINSIIDEFEKRLDGKPADEEFANVFRKFSQVASLFMSQYVTFSFFSYYTKKVLSAEDLASISERMSDIESSSSCNFDVFNLSNKFAGLKSNNDLKSSQILRFYISLGYLLTDKKLTTAIKCMRLYAWGFISHEQAVTWLEACHDGFISELFNDLASSPKNDLLPSHVFDSMAKEVKDGTLEWIFGSDLFAILKDEPKTEAKNLIQLSNERALKKNTGEFVNSDQSAVPYIADLKTTKFFGTLKAGARAIRTGKHIMAEIPEGVIESVLGQNCQVDKTDQFYRVFFRKVRELGAEASRTHIGFLQDKFESMNPSTPDGRAAYAERMMPNTILRELVFSGARFECPPKEIFDKAFAVASKTMERFSGIGPKYSNMVTAIKRGTVDCDDGAVLALYYFMELVRVISLLDGKQMAAVESIPTLVFSEEPPLQGFQGEVIANIDIILLNMAKQLKKLNEEQLVNQTTLSFSGDFVFHVEMKDEIVISPGTMNMLYN